MIRSTISFLSGLVVGSICAILLTTGPYFEVDKKFSVSAILNLLVTLGIALLIQYYLSRRGGTDKAKKELLIASAKDVISSVRDLHLVIRSVSEQSKISQTDFQRIVAAFKMSGMGLENFRVLLEHAGVKQILTGDAMKTLGHYREAVTGGDFPKHPITHDRMSHYDSLYQALMRQLNILILNVNQGE